MIKIQGPIAVACCLLVVAAKGSVARASAAPSEAITYEAFTKPLPLYPGEVTNTWHKLTIPKGPIAISEFAADIVEQDDDGHYIPVPLSDAYLHHHVVYSSHKYYASHKRWWSPMKPETANRGVGFGAGTESRGTRQVFPYPYRFTTVQGEDELVANVHVINTRTMTSQQAHHCLECPCTQEDYYQASSSKDKEGGLFSWFHHDKESTSTAHSNTTLLDSVIARRHHWDRCNAPLTDEHNTACSPETYHGGLICCEHGEFCLDAYFLEEIPKADKITKLRPQSTTLNETQSTFFLRYTLTYTPLEDESSNNDEIQPLYLAACCDASGNLTTSGNIEYDIPKLCDDIADTSEECIHTLETVQTLHGASNAAFGTGDTDDDEETEQWVDVVYMVGHLHRGGMEISAYAANDSALLCQSLPTYGNGSVGEIGNEPNYINAMSTCTFDPPLRMKTTDKIRIVGKYNATQAHTGVMSLFYIAMADVESIDATVVADKGFWKRFQLFATVVAAGIVIMASVKVFQQRHGAARRHGYEQVSSVTV